MDGFSHITQILICCVFYYLFKTFFKFPCDFFFFYLSKAISLVTKIFIYLWVLLSILILFWPKDILCKSSELYWDYFLWHTLWSILVHRSWNCRKFYLQLMIVYKCVCVIYIYFYICIYFIRVNCLIVFFKIVFCPKLFFFF